MQSKFYKPIGSILTAGSSVNSGDAFINAKPLPLRAAKGKAINNKPNSVNVPVNPNNRKVDLRNPQAQPQAQSNSNKVKLRQQRLTQMTTTPDVTTSTTSTTSPTSSTTASVTTTRQTTSSMPKSTNSRSNNNRTSSPGSRRGDEPFFTSSSMTESGGSSRAFNDYDKSIDINGFEVNGVKDNISAFPTMASICQLKTEEKSGIYTDESLVKLYIVLSCFASAITDSTINTVTHYGDFMELYFNRLTTDIIRFTKGNVPSVWTKSKLTAYFAGAALALEIFYCLDSILSFANPSVGILAGSVPLQDYASNFNTSRILLVRNKLRQLLQGVWFPSEFANFIRGFYQAYRLRPANETAQAAILRYVPHSVFVGSLTNTGSELDTTFETLLSGLKTILKSDDNNLINGILSNVNPKHIINGLPRSSSDAHYSEEMAELFSNECHIFPNTTSANASSATPISYDSLKNDICYYSYRNPRNANGAIYALQAIPVTTASSGLAWANSSSSYFGMRKPLSNGTGVNLSNKFYYDSTSNTVVPRNLANTKSIMLNVDNHVAYVEVVSGTSSIKTINAPLSGQQRLYYDSQSAPSTLLTELLSKLYGTSS